MRPCSLIAIAFCGLIVHSGSLAGQTKEPIPDFAVRTGTAWQSDTREGLAPLPSGPQPPGTDPAFFKDHQYDMDTDFPVMDVSNSNLQPWVAEALKAQNEQVLSGKPLQPRSSSCWPHGLPAFMRYNGPTFFIQSQNEVLILKNQSSEMRRVALNAQHSAHPKPSWYGESIGHYENGDTLVVDTVGLTDRTSVDLFRTPHTQALHVTERWALAEGGREIVLKVRVEDPGAFKQPYELTKHYRRAGATWLETICAENPIGPIDQGLEPTPQSATPDF
jgi:hypothetical protein